MQLSPIPPVDLVCPRDRHTEITGSVRAPVVLTRQRSPIRAGTAQRLRSKTSRCGRCREETCLSTLGRVRDQCVDRGHSARCLPFAIAEERRRETARRGIDRLNSALSCSCGVLQRCLDYRNTSENQSEERVWTWSHSALRCGETRVPRSTCRKSKIWLYSVGWSCFPQIRAADEPDAYY